MAARGSDAPRVRVGAVVMYDGNIVLVRHRKDGRAYHLLPGGGVSLGEPLWSALQREVFEETGLQVRPLRPLFIVDSIDPSGARHVIDVTFLAQMVGGGLTEEPRDERVEAVELADPSTLPSLDFRPPIAEDILGAIEDGFTASARYLGARWVEER